MDLTEAEIATLRKIWMQPHKVTSIDLKLLEPLREAGLVKPTFAMDRRPLEQKGSALCCRLIKEGRFG